MNGPAKLTSPPVLLATWFGVGMIKPAPGTWGSAAALPFGAALTHFGGPWSLLAAIVVVMTSRTAPLVVITSSVNMTMMPGTAC